ncbi:hypothetical protein GA0115245_10542 [Streptomyces sp. di188]|nr:hypothetical protein GA0115245_10542 [Streptomyces sp. di188]SCD49977.1 hypothetical protein GA0115238_11211 [Streptomyces sp. di50b]
MGAFDAVVVRDGGPVLGYLDAYEDEETGPHDGAVTKSISSSTRPRS